MQCQIRIRLRIVAGVAIYIYAVELSRLHAYELKQMSPTCVSLGGDGPKLDTDRMLRLVIVLQAMSIASYAAELLPATTKRSTG